MSTQDQARALMTRHHHLVKNRQQSMLTRVMAESGIPSEHLSWNSIQGKPYGSARDSYDRSNAALS
ncbi:MAG: hypothetical protein ACFE0J_05745 [Elainellaceae cyanobacterium]